VHPLNLMTGKTSQHVTSGKAQTKKFPPTGKRSANNGSLTTPSIVTGLGRSSANYSRRTSPHKIRHSSTSTTRSQEASRIKNLLRNVKNIRSRSQTRSSPQLLKRRKMMLCKCLKPATSEQHKGGSSKFATTSKKRETCKGIRCCFSTSTLTRERHRSKSPSRTTSCGTSSAQGSRTEEDRQEPKRSSNSSRSSASRQPWDPRQKAQANRHFAA